MLSLHLLFSFALVAWRVAAVDEVIQLTAAPDYSNLRPCATPCLKTDGAGNLPNGMTCSANSCICRSDLKVLATSQLSYCVLRLWCSSNSFDYSQVLGIYNGYCSSYSAARGIVASSTPIVTPAPSSRSPSAAASVDATTPTPTTTSSQGGGGSNGGSSSKIDKGTLIGIIIGAVAAVIALAAIIWQARDGSKTREVLRSALGRGGGGGGGRHAPPSYHSGGYYG